MHDLVHDLALSVAQTECLTITSRMLNILEKVKHASSLDYDLLEEEVMGPLLKLKNVWTIFSPLSEVGLTDESFIDACISRFKSLRVLDLSDSDFEVLPSSIGNLIHLRYLILTRNCRIKRLTNSICKLHNLQTLELWGCEELEELPNDMRDLVRLRHLELTTKQSCLLEKRTRWFISLRSLYIFKCGNLVSLSEEGKQDFAALRTLAIWECERLTSLVGSVKYLIALETLLIWDCPQLDLMMQREDDIKGHMRLRSLDIIRLPRLVALPQWLEGATNTLQFLHNEHCENLATLLEWLGNLKSLLQKLEVEQCHKLKCLPEEGFHGLTTLRVLKIDYCGELSRRCKSETGDDWAKITHVPEITIDYKKIKSTNN